MLAQHCAGMKALGQPQKVDKGSVFLLLRGFSIIFLKLFVRRLRRSVSLELVTIIIESVSE
jgi:hypothetical protein